MMTITVKRIAYREKYVISKLSINGTYLCDVMENTKHIIPKGEYPITLYPSPSQKTICPLLHNVPNRSYILIHKGNKPEHSRGCLLVGYNTQIGTLTQSTIAFEKLMKILNNSQNIKITIQ